MEDSVHPQSVHPVPRLHLQYNAHSSLVFRLKTLPFTGVISTASVRPHVWILTTMEKCQYKGEPWIAGIEIRQPSTKGHAPQSDLMRPGDTGVRPLPSDRGRGSAVYVNYTPQGGFVTAHLNQILEAKDQAFSFGLTE